MSALTSARSLGRSSSLQLPGQVASFGAPCGAKPGLRRPALSQCRPSGRSLNRSLRVDAHMGDKVFATVQQGAKRFIGRYDPVATGVGSLLVTGYCVVVHQQPVEEALNIAAGATILGMVLQEVLFNHDQQSLN